MAKEFKVFFSWQSDLSANQTTRFIEESIEMAKTLLPDSILLVPDEATRNRLGSPDIVNSIFEKINDCDLFIADVSIVGQYSPPAVDDEEPEIKYLPNPNVMLELGYAASRISWDRCICLANTKFGPIANLPFDLNHRRITDFSYDGTTRKQKISEIAEIIKSTVLAFSDSSLPKKGFSYHSIGGFNLNNGNIENRIIPYNDIAIALFSSRTEHMIQESIATIDKITHIKLPHIPVTNEDDNLDTLTKNMTLGEILKDPVLSKRFTLKMSKSHPVKINKETIGARAKQYLGIELDDDFYYLGNLLQTTPMSFVDSPTLEGSDQEREKYSLISDLRSSLLSIELREMFKNLFKSIIIVPLSIKNLSEKTDERISISIKVICGRPVPPTAQFFNQDYAGLEGNVFDEHLVKELLALPENSVIRYDSSVPVPPETPVFDVCEGFFASPSDEADYEEELQEYVQDIDEGTSDEYSFYIGALRPNETFWLDRVLLIEPVNGQIIINYSIKSNNTTGHIHGTLQYDSSDC